MLVFGPDKLPKVIQDVMGFIRKVREFSDSAKEDIRSELGPEFKDFEFEDLKPKNFVRKHVLEKDEYGLKDLQEIRNGFDLKKEMAEVTDAVHGRDERLRPPRPRTAQAPASPRSPRPPPPGARPGEEGRRPRAGRASAVRRRRHLTHTGMHRLC